MYLSFLLINIIIIIFVYVKKIVGNIISSDYILYNTSDLSGIVCVSQMPQSGGQNIFGGVRLCLTTAAVCLVQTTMEFFSSYWCSFFCLVAATTMIQISAVTD